MSARGFDVSSARPRQYDGEHRVRRCPERCRRRRWRLQRTAGVARRPLSPTGERRHRAVRAQRPSRRECAASHRARHTKWREATACTHGDGLRVVTGTASDVRAQWPRRCIYAAFRRVTEGSNPRDGLLKAITPSPLGAQRSSPNDSRKGSNSRALTALLESWVNDSRDWAVPQERHRDAE